MAQTTVTDWLTAPLFCNTSDYHRQRLVIHGDKHHHATTVEDILSSLPEDISFCIAGELNARLADIAKTRIAKTTPLNLYRQCLGSEYDIVIIDFSEQFRPSVLTALAGTVKVSGTLILLTPPSDTWHSHPSVTRPYFLSYGQTLNSSVYIDKILRPLTDTPETGMVSRDSVYLPSPQAVEVSRISESDRLTATQQKVFDKITQDDCSTYKCVCIEAARGRGKSFLSGKIIAHFLKLELNVAVTAYSQASVSGLLASSECESGNRAQWMATDNPLLSEDNIDVLVIDEAAALPLPLLQRLLSTPAFVILSSTTDGYEGSGQGFRTKFLQPHNIPVRKLSEPVRWRGGDQLETLVSNLTFRQPLSHEEPGDPREPVSPEHRVLQAKDMQPSTLRQVLEMLTVAHYQSSPDDMLRLTDSPQNNFHLLTVKGKIIAAAVVEHEGSIAPVALTEHIAEGKRRVKGHLTAQSLALMSTDANFASMKIRRINRIAVSPDWQSKGLGSKLLKQIVFTCQTGGADLLTSSFGADDQLLRFWVTNGFTIVKRGSKPDKASGLISALVVNPVSQRAEEAIDQLLALEENNELPPLLRKRHLLRVRQFVEGSRSIDHLYSSLNYLIQLADRAHSGCDIELASILRNLSAGESLKQLADRTGLQGKKEMVNDLRRRCEQLLSSGHDGGQV